MHIYNSLNYRRRLKVNIKISCIHHATTEKVVCTTYADFKYNNVFFLLRKGNDQMNFMFRRNLCWLLRRNFVIEKEDLLSKLLMDLDFSFKADVIG